MIYSVNHIYWYLQKWAKYFAPLLKPFSSNNYAVKGSFDFTRDNTQQSFFMASFGVDSLFTNVPLNEIIEIRVNELFKSSQTASGFNRQKVLEMCSLTTKKKKHSFIRSKILQSNFRE